ncbi:Molybdate transporter 2 [Striga hermonthica]|uniref:Molybdate transporter 2 n=1 Tax=Striga hermonthica TaxID=68872 RepID=A0A9N7N8N7_STRHE|nr:Molybdate transporter 2 [Striga hermonthica]
MSDGSADTPLLHPHLQGWRRRITSAVSLKTSLPSELSGAVGDLGTYIPIVLALTLVSNLDLSTTLIFTAAYNIATGVLFGTPMPVQPMKSIAAVAVSETPHLTVSQIAAAGISTAAVLLFLGVTGLMSVLYRFLPLPVVRGVQLSQGLAFAFSAIRYIRYNQDFTITTSTKTTDPRPWLGLDGLILSLTCLLFLIITTGDGTSNQTNTNTNTQNPRNIQKRLKILLAIPSALIIFLLGLILCFVRDPFIFHDLTLGPSGFHVLTITWNDFKTGFLRGAVPQIPLSVLNSVIAVCKLSGDLFPGTELSAAKVSVSVGLMNLVGCWFGAMPVCHGAGGLAGQYRFGGRSGLSVVFLGLGKLVIGLLFGNSFVRILRGFPVGILGVLLLFAGIELAMASRDMNTKEDSLVMLVCTAVSLTGSSAALGFACGIVLHVVLKLRVMDFSSLGFPGTESSGSGAGGEDDAFPSGAPEAPAKASLCLAVRVPLDRREVERFQRVEAVLVPGLGLAAIQVATTGRWVTVFLPAWLRISSGIYLGFGSWLRFYLGGDRGGEVSPFLSCIPFVLGLFGGDGHEAIQEQGQTKREKRREN